MSAVGQVDGTQSIDSQKLQLNYSLRFSIDAGDIIKVKQLLQEDIDLNTKIVGETFLMFALQSYELEIAKLLVEKGAEVRHSDDRDSLLSAVILGIIFSRNHKSRNQKLELEVLQLLIEKGATVNPISKTNEISLSKLIQVVDLTGKGEILQFLIVNGADVNEVDDGFDVLNSAILAKEDELAELLIERGAKVDGNCEVVPLVFASNRVTKCLLKHGAAVDKKCLSGMTPLISAAAGNEVERVKLLLKYGATIDILDDKGFSALRRASKNGHKDMVELLLENGAYVDKNDSSWINDLENDDIIEILQKASRKNSAMIEKIEEMVPSDIDFEDVENKIVRVEFDRKLFKLEENLQSEMKGIKTEIRAVEEKLKEVKGKNDVLFEIYTRKRDILNEQRKLYFNPSTRTFYFTISALLELKLKSMMLLLGHVLKREETKKERVIVGGTEVATGALDAIPIAGGMVGNAINVFSREVMGKKIDGIKLKQAKRLLRLLGNPKGASKFAELLARRVAQKYEEIFRGKRISLEQAQAGGEKVVELVFKAIIDQKNILAFDENFVKKLIGKIEEEHKKENLFGSTKTEVEASRSLHDRVSEIADNQRAISERQELMEARNKELKIKSLTEQAILDQFNSMIVVDFPPIADPDPLFEIVMNEKISKYNSL